MSYYEPWILEIIAAVQKFEDEHSYKDNYCMNAVLEKVPADARSQAIGYSMARAQAAKETAKSAMEAGLS